MGKKKVSRQRLFLWIQLLAWMAFIFALSAVPGRHIPRVPLPHFHKLVHFVEYFILGALMTRLLLQMGVREEKLAAVCLMAILLFALSDEGHQILVPGRGPFVGDVLNDTVFGLIGVNAYAAVHSLVMLNRQK